MLSKFLKELIRLEITDFFFPRATGEDKVNTVSGEDD